MKELHNMSTFLDNLSHEENIVDYFSRMEFKVAYGLIVSIIIILNVFVILVISLNRSLRETSLNWITMSLSFTDFIVGCSIRPMISMQDADNFLGCVIAFSFYVTAIAASSFHLLLISLIRVYGYLKQKTTFRKIKKKTVFVVVCLTWTLAIIVDVNENVYWLDMEKNTLIAGCNFASLYKENYRDVTRFHSIVHLVTLLFTMLCNFGLVFKLYFRGVAQTSPSAGENIVPRFPQDNSNKSTLNRELQKGSNVHNNENENKYDKATTSTCTGSITSHPIAEFRVEFPSSGETDTDGKSDGVWHMKISHVKTILEGENIVSEYDSESEMYISQSSIRSPVLDGRKVSTEVKPDIGLTIPKHVDLESRTSILSNDKIKGCILNPTIMTRHRHIRAIWTLVIIVLAHAVFTGPFYLYLFVRGFMDKEETRCIRIEMILLAFATVNSIVNPILYIIRVPEFRQVIKDFKKKITCKSKVHVLV